MMYQLDINITATNSEYVQWTVSFTLESDSALKTCATCELSGTKAQFESFCESFKYVIGQIGPASEAEFFNSVFSGGHVDAGKDCMCTDRGTAGDDFANDEE